MMEIVDDYTVGALLTAFVLAVLCAALLLVAWSDSE